MFYIFCGLMTAIAAGFLLHPVQASEKRDSGDRKLSATLLLVLPLSAAVLYGMLGHPDLPSHPAAQVADPEQLQRRQVMMLAEKPVEVIEKTGGMDAGALAVMADLNLRLGSRENAEKFMKRAVDAAEKTGDVNLDTYRRQLKELKD